MNSLFARIFDVFRRFEPNGEATAPCPPASYGHDHKAHLPKIFKRANCLFHAPQIRKLKFEASGIRKMGCEGPLCKIFKNSLDIFDT